MESLAEGGKGSGGARLAAGAHRTYELAAALFLRALGAAFAIAFASLWVQLDGLFGVRGISPVGEFLPWAGQQLGSSAYWRIPSVFWLGASDGVLHALCGAGIAFSALMAVGIGQRWALVTLWILYLSFVSVGDVFLSYQWDSLLLETAFLSIFLAPGQLLPRGLSRADPLAVWLLRWLLFRLMFLSGVVKLASGDAAWRDLTALRFHYWTQPLPTPIAYYAHLLPDAAQLASAGVMFAVELVVPFFIFGPRRARLLAGAAIALLQAAIALTGNYGFFNVLCLALCLLLLDDAALVALLPVRLRSKVPAVPIAPPRRRGRQVAYVLASGLFVALSVAEMRFWRPLRPFERVLALLQPFRSINSYGLFAVMTTHRPEILVQGSEDGRSWGDYEFKWKPGALEASPRFVAPHQPRLDWQMWFAALETCAGNPWFIRFQHRLLEASPPVLRLLRTNPFPRLPPRYIRAVMYQYRFATWAERRSSGRFWERTPVGLYCPILALRDGRLISVGSTVREAP